MKKLIQGNEGEVPLTSTTQSFKVVSEVGGNFLLATQNKNAELSVGSITVPKEPLEIISEKNDKGEVKEKEKHRNGVFFDVKYDCEKLKSEDRWWDDVSFTLTNADDANLNAELKFKVLCQPENLYGLDLSMFVLFGIATIIVWIAFYTPDLSIMDEMTDQERED
jgi:hypothetical protein